mmetsp:Transcript_43487/g.125558  ORF Transcript_43487/g.125558 Transcript_43487/m.125558 type:complete len:250 (-) Transcript_43487:314-1063(-)
MRARRAGILGSQAPLMAERLHGAGPVLWQPLQQLAEQVLALGGDAAPRLPLQRRPPAPADELEERLDAAGQEGGPAAQQLVREAPDAPHVALGAVARAGPGHLGRHADRGADVGPGNQGRALQERGDLWPVAVEAKLGGEPKVRNLDVGVHVRGLQEDVLGLQIAVYHAHSVHVVHGLEHLLDHAPGTPLREAPQPEDAVAQASAVGALHEDPERLLALDDVDEAHDVPVPQLLQARDLYVGLRLFLPA